MKMSDNKEDAQVINDNNSVETKTNVNEMKPDNSKNDKSVQNISDVEPSSDVNSEEEVSKDTNTKKERNTSLKSEESVVEDITSDVPDKNSCVPDEIVEGKEVFGKTTGNDKMQEKKKVNEAKKRGEHEIEAAHSVPLLDQPLEQKGKRERKSVQRYSENTSKEIKGESKNTSTSGSGVALGNIPRIESSITRFKTSDLNLLHRILYNTPGKTSIVKSNIKKFSGFNFKADSNMYMQRSAVIQKFEMKHLKSVCEMLDLQKTGSKDDIVKRILDFLLEPRDSGRTTAGGRPKRSAAVKANNRGYSSHDNYSSDEKHAGSRSHKHKDGRSSFVDSESDEDFHPSDSSDDGPKKKRRMQKRYVSRRKPPTDYSDESFEETDKSSQEEEDDESDNNDSNSGEYVPKNNNSKQKQSTQSNKKRGRRPLSSPNKSGTSSTKRNKNKDENEKSNDDDKNKSEEENSTSEDEPLIKKAKTSQPPNDDELKGYIKEILKGANLEQITMKTVCQKVYAHYPDFDLVPRKDFIKSTVKSLISN